jgi:hypothetical protein
VLYGIRLWRLWPGRPIAERIRIPSGADTQVVGNGQIVPQTFVANMQAGCLLH